MGSSELQAPLVLRTHSPASLGSTGWSVGGTMILTNYKHDTINMCNMMCGYTVHVKCPYIVCEIDGLWA